MSQQSEKHLKQLSILKERLDVAEQTLEAIRSGGVDALIVDGPEGENIYTLTGAEHPYRVMVETMSEGAVTFGPEGTIFYCNRRFSEMIGAPINTIIGSSIYEFIRPGSMKNFERLLWQSRSGEGRGEIDFRALKGSSVPVVVSLSHIRLPDILESMCLVATDIKDRKLAENEIKRSHGKLRAMVAELIQTEERERQRIATVLHDSVAQTLGVAKMKLEILQDSLSPEEVRRMDEVRNLISESIQQTRHIMSELSPQVLYELGFVPAVEWLAEQIQEQHGIEMYFSGGNVTPASHEVEAVLFQAIRELLMNIVKHSRASSSIIKLSGDSRQMTVEVIDDGVGFNKNSSENRCRDGGFGLFSIRERLSHFGGRLTISSKSGKGTRVKITVPA